MALFFLDYDLRKQRNYQPLYDALKQLNAVRVLESTWCLKLVDVNASALRDHFRQYVDHDDGLCVTQVADWATWRAIATP